MAGIGVFLPLLPTTPFVLLSATCFAKSSPALHAWLAQHRLFGPILENWQRKGAIAPGAKMTALATMAGALLISLLLQLAPLVIAIQLVVLGAAALFVVTRPNP